MEPETKKIKFDDESVAIGWFDLPYEMRRIVIDYMSMRTKFRFARCSKDCYEEVQLSRNVLELIELSEIGRPKIGVCFEINDYSDNEYCFVICDRSKRSTYSKMPLRAFREDLHRFETNTEEEFDEYFAQMLRGLMKLAKNSLDRLWIFMSDFPYDKMKMENIRKLSEIILGGNIKNLQIDPISSGFIEFEQLCAVSHFIDIPKLTFDQLLQMKTKIIKIGSEDFEEDPIDIAPLMNRIFDGELDENVELISFRPEPNLENVRGIFAQRLSCWNYPSFELLVERFDKVVAFEYDVDETFSIVPNYSPDLRQWTPL